MTKGMSLLQEQNLTFIRFYWWQNDPIYRTFDERYMVSQYLLLALREKESPKLDLSSGASINAL